METHATSLKGKLLLAMPGMDDPRFHKAVIFICSDNEEGSMGIVLNHQLAGMVLGDLFTEVGLDTPPQERSDEPVMMGGPVETSRGFLLHTMDYDSAETIKVNDKFGVSGTLEALKSYAEGQSPRNVLFALGYAGWGPGQLSQEILDNAWLVVDADYELIFNTDITDRWTRAMSRHGIDPARLSGNAGHA